MSHVIYIFIAICLMLNRFRTIKKHLSCLSLISGFQICSNVMKYFWNVAFALIFQLNFQRKKMIPTNATVLLLRTLGCICNPAVLLLWLLYHFFNFKLNELIDLNLYNLCYLQELPVLSCFILLQAFWAEGLIKKRNE